MKRWASDLGAWASSLRFSAFTVIVVALVAAGAIIVSPSLSTYVQQQREISELRESVRQHQESVNTIDAERAKWKDPVYIRSQARDRLFYVMPGETQLGVIDDITLPLETAEETSATLSEIHTNWARGLASSFLVAGTATPAQDAGADPAATPDSGESPDPASQTSPQTPEETTP